jgi:hypothetical protein
MSRILGSIYVAAFGCVSRLGMYPVSSSERDVTGGNASLISGVKSFTTASPISHDDNSSELDSSNSTFNRYASAISAGTQIPFDSVLCSETDIEHSILDSVITGRSSKVAPVFGEHAPTRSGTSSDSVVDVVGFDIVLPI